MSFLDIIKRRLSCRIQLRLVYPLSRVCHQAYSNFDSTMPSQSSQISGFDVLEDKPNCELATTGPQEATNSALPSDSTPDTSVDRLDQTGSGSAYQQPSQAEPSPVDMARPASSPPRLQITEPGYETDMMTQVERHSSRLPLRNRIAWEVRRALQSGAATEIKVRVRSGFTLAYNLSDLATQPDLAQRLLDGLADGILRLIEPQAMIREAYDGYDQPMGHRPVPWEMQTDGEDTLEVDEHGWVLNS